MFTRLKRTCTFHIKSNITYYVLILCGFVGGGVIAAACVFGLSELSAKELFIYFSDFFESINKTGSDSFAVFKMAALSNLKFYVVVILLSMMVIGSPFIAVMSAFFGYSFCFTLLFMLKSYGIKGILFFAGGMLPHQLIIFPCIILTLIISMQFSVSLFKGKNNMKSMLPSYLVKMTALFSVSVLAALLQGYIEPLFIELMSPLFLT